MSNSTEWTQVRMEKTVLKELKKHGEMGDSYNTVVKKLLKLN